MTYRELEVNTEIRLKERLDSEFGGERRKYRQITCTVVEKYPYMCIVEDGMGRRRGVAVGELVMNGVVTQEPCFEALRLDAGSRGVHAGRHCRNAKQ